MRGEGLDLFTKESPLPKSTVVATGLKIIFFILPSAVITTVSIVLFIVLKNFSSEQLNNFTITILIALILSLLGATIGQLLVQKIIDSGAKKVPAIYQGIKTGVLFSICFSIVAVAIFYPYFAYVLVFPLTSFIMFALLLLMYLLIWSITAAFWAVEQNKYPAVIFTVSYISLLFITYALHQINADYTLAGYTAGILLLLIFSIAGIRMAFGKQKEKLGLPKDSSVRFLIFSNSSIILFHILHLFAIFLDKIIAWIWQGWPTWELVISGSYTNASFIGLIPTFSIATVIYFGAKVKPLLSEMYSGTIFEIKERIGTYKQQYRKALRTIVFVSILLLLFTMFFVIMYVPGTDTFRIFYLVGTGVLFLTIIILNSTILPLFGQARISLLALSCICIFELLSIPLLRFGIWYLSLGFMLGCFVGCFISELAVIRLFSAFEYNLFHNSTKSALNIK